MDPDTRPGRNGGGETSSSSSSPATVVSAAAKSAEEWTRFLSTCISKRLDPAKFESFVSILASRHPLPAPTLADIFLRPHAANHESLDPRVPRYLQILSEKQLIDTPSVLRALYKYSTSQAHAEAAGEANVVGGGDQSPGSPLRWKSSYGSEETIFYRLTKAVSMGSGIRSASDALEVCKTMARWMNLFTSASAAFAQDVMGQLAQPRDDMEASRAAFVMLLLSVCEYPLVLKALSRPFAKDARKVLSESLGNFVPSIMQSASQIAERLEFFRTETLSSFEPVDAKKEAAKAEINDILDSTMGLDSYVVPELPITNSRAGLYIYLNAALVGIPLIDDTALFNYLHNRYGADMQATAIDLILASFDVLANAVFRREHSKAAHVLRSYLINKLPVLLATLAASMFPPVTAQYCITEALSQVDTNAFPTLSSMFDDSNSNTTLAGTDTVRQDFCFACCLHGLIPESAIEGLLGDITYQRLPEGGRYIKETLVEQCVADPERIQSLIGELDNMDGNVGAVCQALTEVISRLCTNKETMSLKLLCSQIAKKPLSLDVMLLFERPATILRPLCDLLDNWQYDEDQGEYQPVYEEFGSILLLVLAFAQRYSLSIAELGIRTPDSFIAKLLSSGHLCRPLEELNEQEQSHLGGWIQGLFATETGGLGDELMSSCPPQQFYLLTATLFYQIVLAISTDCLKEDSLKSGIEYLVDTFLVPSLVTAMTYLSNHLRLVRPPEQKAVITILQSIILTKQGSNEAQSMLIAVINTVARPLEHGLRSYQRQEPKSQEVEPLLKAIKDNLRVSRRTSGAHHNELEGWTSAANGGLVASFRHTFQGFVQWSLHPGVNVPPASYTHRQTLAALRLVGPKRLLHVMLDEMKQQTDAGSLSIVYDVAVALICAPNKAAGALDPVPSLLADPSQQAPLSTQTRVTMLGALRWEAEDFKKIQKSDPITAENVVRLYRRVEAQMIMPPPAEMLQGDLTLGLGDDDDGAAAAASLGDALAAAAAAAQQTEGLGADDHTSLDLGLGGASAADMGLDLHRASTAGLDLGADDDIFGSLGGVGDGDDLLEGWDNMDLS